MEKYKTEFKLKLKVVKSFLTGDGAANLNSTEGGTLEAGCGEAGLLVNDVVGLFSKRYPSIVCKTRLPDIESFITEETDSNSFAEILTKRREKIQAKIHLL